MREIYMRGRDVMAVLLTAALLAGLVLVMGVAPVAAAGTSMGPNPSTQSVNMPNSFHILIDYNSDQPTLGAGVTVHWTPAPNIQCTHVARGPEFAGAIGVVGSPDNGAGIVSNSGLVNFTPLAAGTHTLLDLTFTAVSGGVVDVTLTDVIVNDALGGEIQGIVVDSGTVSVNQPPSQPSNASPANGATRIALTPTLQASAFSDPDSVDNHAASQWQITTTAGDYSSPVFDSGTDSSNLTSINTSALSYSTSYYWHVRYQDNHGAWSAWSAETSFTTAAPPNNAPNQPSNASPANGATGIALTPTLQASVFSDMDSGDTHAASQWQIITMAGDYSSPVFDSGSDAAHLTSIATSALSYSTSYYWHVRYQDNHGAWSGWSTQTSFTTATANQPPSQPSNASPANGATGVSLTPALQASAFSDPNSGDTHAASQWQITTTANDYSSLVLDTGSDAAHLTSITTSTLSDSTTYYWRVRYQDNRGAWSAWSTETSFTTAPNPVIAEVDPRSGKQEKRLEVTLTGSGFSGATEVSFGAGITVDDFTVQSDSQIAVEISIDGDATVGARNVSVQTGGGTAAKADGFTVTSGNGGICNCGTSKASAQPSELTVPLAALGVVLGTGYCLARKSREKPKK